MNSGKLRITTHLWLQETKFQKHLSSTVLQKAKKEDDKLGEQHRDIKHYMRTFFVSVPPLFVHFIADFDWIFDSDDIWTL